MTKKDLKKWQELRTFALGLPEAWEDFPWEEVVAKVNKKVFVFLGRPEGESLGISVKLTQSRDHAMTIPGATPTGYGLGKSGWVSVPITSVETDLLCDWIEESYRNVAPKRVASRLDEPQ